MFYVLNIVALLIGSIHYKIRTNELDQLEVLSLARSYVQGTRCYLHG